MKGTPPEEKRIENSPNAGVFYLYYHKGVYTTMKYKEWLTTWLEIYKLPHVGKKQQSNCMHAVAIINRSPIAEKDVKEISEQDLQIILNTSKKLNSDNGYSKSMLEKIRLVMRQSFRPLVRNGTITVSPATELILPLASTKEILPLTHSEQDAVEAACYTDALGHLILFLLDTGLRMSEMTNLKWEHYNPDDGQYGSIFIADSKTPAGVRKVYLIYRARQIIGAQERINEYIFNHTRHKPVTKTVMRRLVDRIRKKSGVMELACHVCRHTFVTRLAERGAPVKAIAQIIGHANSDYVLDIYAKLEADELRKTIYILDPKHHHSTLMGAPVHLPVSLYNELTVVASEQHTNIDMLITFLLTTAIEDIKKKRK